MSEKASKTQRLVALSNALSYIHPEKQDEGQPCCGPAGIYGWTLGGSDKTRLNQIRLRGKVQCLRGYEGTFRSDPVGYFQLPGNGLAGGLHSGYAFVYGLGYAL